MQKVLIITLLLTSLTNAFGQNVVFNDPVFKQKLIDHTPPTLPFIDGEITEEAAATVERIVMYRGQGITDITGIEKFTNLKELLIVGADIDHVDLSLNQELEAISLRSCNLLTVNIKENHLLTYLHLTSNRLREIELPDGVVLESLRIERNLISSIDISNCTVTTPPGINENPNLVTANLTNQTFRVYDESLGEDVITLGGIGRYCPNLEFICIDSIHVEEAINNIGQPGYSDYEVSTNCTQDPPVSDEYLEIYPNPFSYHEQFLYVIDYLHNDPNTNIEGIYIFDSSGNILRFFPYLEVYVIYDEDETGRPFTVYELDLWGLGLNLTPGIYYVQIEGRITRLVVQ